jgi:hypothetical protein
MKLEVSRFPRIDEEKTYQHEGNYGTNRRPPCFLGSFQACIVDEEIRGALERRRGM